MDVNPGYKRTEVGVIPEDWQARPLEGLLSIGHGYGFESRYFASAGEYQLMTPGNFKQVGGFRKSAESRYFSGPVLDNYVLTAGDLVVAMTEQAEGLLGCCAIVPDEGRYLHNQRIGRIIGRSQDLSVGFLYHLFNAPSFRKSVQATAAGMKVRHTSPTRLLRVTVALPATKEEQDSIASVLSDAEALIEALERLLAKKRQLKQAVMHQLLTGKTRLPGFTGEWEERRLGDLCVVDPEALSPDWTAAKPFRYISLENVAEGRLLGWSAQTLAKAPSRARRRIRKDDILVSTVRPQLRAHLRFGEAGDDWVCSTGFAVLRCEPQKADPAFVFATLFGTAVQLQINSLVAGSNYPAISSRDVAGLAVAVPPIDEQRAIGALVEALDADIDSACAALAKWSSLAAGIRAALLSGTVRLVAEDVLQGPRGSA